LRLAQLYLAGEGVTADATIAASWLQRAVDADDLDARVALAQLYLRGQGVERDEAEAEALLTRAVKHNHLPALLQLGHLRGQQGQRDEAMRLYRAAGEAGYLEAQLFLANLYLRGKNIPHSAEMASVWFRSR
jgi:uncharacterized protein